MQLEQFIVTDTNHNYECNGNIVAAVTWLCTWTAANYFAADAYTEARNSGAELNISCNMKGTLYEI